MSATKWLETARRKVTTYSVRNYNLSTSLILITILSGRFLIPSFPPSLLPSFFPSLLPFFFYFFWDRLLLCHPGWSAVVWSGLTATSAPRFKQFSASASWVAGITGTHHHDQLILVFLVETRFRHLGQAGLELLTLWSSKELGSQVWATAPGRAIINFRW